MSLPYRLEPGRLVLYVRLTPKSGRDALEGVETGADGKRHVKVRVRAVPEDGKANAALEIFLSGKAHLPRSAVAVISGQTARLKLVSLNGEPATILAALGIA